MTVQRFCLGGLLALLLASCALNSPMQPAPVTSSPVSERPDGKRADSLPAKTTQAAPQTVGSEQYLVQKGDTLSSIGRKFGIPFAKLAEFNGLKAPYELQVGQVLNLKAPHAKATASSNNATDNAGSEEAEVVISAIARPELAATKDSNDSKPSATTSASTSATSAAKTADNGFETLADNELRWQWPLTGKLLNGFDAQTNKGLNLAGTSNQPITAASAGKVIYSGTDVRGTGRLIIIKHNSNLLSVYAHQGTALVKEGVFVSAGDKLATLPANGSPQALSLHFEIRLKGKPVDPATYLPAMLTK